MIRGDKVEKVSGECRISRSVPSQKHSEALWEVPWEKGVKKMKKSMLAIAALSAAVAVQAEITSPNVVGYSASDTVVAVNNNFVMLAPNFLNVTDGTLSSDELVCDQITTSFDTTADDFFAGWTDDAACLQVPNGVGGYLLRYYIDDADDGNGNYVTGWADNIGMLNPVSIDLGTGVWVRGKKDTVTKFTFAGAVSENASETVSRTTPINFELVANPYPTAFDINSEKVAWTLATVTSFDTTADDFFAGWTDEAACLQVPNGVGGYLLRYYIDDADDGAGNYVTGWADNIGMLNTATVPAGSGFWLRRCAKEGKTQAWSFTVEL